MKIDEVKTTVVVKFPPKFFIAVGVERQSSARNPVLSAGVGTSVQQALNDLEHNSGDVFGTQRIYEVTL